MNFSVVAPRRRSSRIRADQSRQSVKGRLSDAQVQEFYVLHVWNRQVGRLRSRGSLYWNFIESQLVFGSLPRSESFKWGEWLQMMFVSNIHFSTVALSRFSTTAGRRLIRSRNSPSCNCAPTSGASVLLIKTLRFVSISHFYLVA